MIFYRRFENVSIWIAVIFKISYLKGNRGWLDWTLKWREGTMKSKKEVKAVRIGRWSRGKARWSPKKKSKLVGLDVYAEERHEKVQKGSRSMKKQKIQKNSKKFKKAVDIILMWWYYNQVVSKQRATRKQNKQSWRNWHTR